MNNSPYSSSSDPTFNQPSGESSTAVQSIDLDRTIQDIGMEQTRLDQELQQLRGRTAALIGLLVGLMLLVVGGFTWLTLELQNISQDERQDASNADVALANRVEQLEEQITDLSQAVPGNLTDTLRSNQTTLARVQTQLQQLTTQIKALEQAPSLAPPQPNIPLPNAAPASPPASEPPQPTP